MTSAFPETSSRPGGTAPRVSVAVPFFNEEESLPELLRRAGAVLDELPGGPHEIDSRTRSRPRSGAR